MVAAPVTPLPLSTVTGTLAGAEARAFVYSSGWPTSPCTKAGRPTVSTSTMDSGEPFTVMVGVPRVGIVADWMLPGAGSASGWRG